MNAKMTENITKNSQKLTVISEKIGIEKVLSESVQLSDEEQKSIFEHPKSRKWKVITDPFFHACNELELGEIVKNERFQLSEAMSAIELMDPKMDSGMIRMGKPLGFEGSIKTGILNVVKMDEKELLSTMDATFSSLVSWLEGNSLLQTIYTNLCIYKIHLIKDRKLAAFCAGTLKLVVELKNIIELAFVFEEEDFNVPGFDIKSEDLNEILTLLKSAEEQKSSELNEPLNDRLRFIRLFLVSISFLVPPAKSGKKALLDQAARHLDMCLKVLKNIQGTIEFGLQPMDNGDGNFDWLPAFDSSVNRHILPATFPRKTQFFTRKRSIVYLITLVEKLLLIVSILPQKVQNIEATLTFLRSFSKDDSNVLSRSILQLVYIHEDCKVLGTTMLTTIIADSLREFAPSPLFESSCQLFENETCAILWQEFLSDCVKVYLCLVQNCGHNRARQRERIPAVLEDLATLQIEANKLDLEIRHLQMCADIFPPSFPVINGPIFGSFVLHHILLVMTDYFSLGLELHLFAPYEFPYVYWYSSEIVFKWLVSVSDQLHNLHVSEYHQSSKDKSKSERRHNYRQKKEVEIRKRIVQEQEQIIIQQAKQALCAAFFKTSVGLILSARIKVPLGGGEKFRLEHRMKVFACLNSPFFIRYEQFKEMARQ